MTFEDIKKRHMRGNEQLFGSTMHPMSSADAVKTHRDRGELIKMVEALQHLAHPHGQTIDKLPLVVYFTSEQDRQGFIDAVRDSLPNMRSVKLP